MVAQSTLPVLRQQAEQLGATLPPLLVAAQRVADTVLHGAHGRRRVGRGDTFWQFRRYQPGDAATSIDWRQSARSQKMFVREKEWSSAQSVWLWPDRSPSMDYRSEPALATKGERACLIALALAAVLNRGGERLGLLGADPVAGSGRRALEQLAASLEMSLDALASDQPSLPELAPVPRYSHLVLISDFLSPLDEIEAVFADYAARGAIGHVLCVTDPAEETLPFTGRVRFIGLEGDGEYTVGRAQSLQREYQARISARREALALLCRRFNWTFSAHRTDRPPQLALLALYTALGEDRE